MSTLLTLTIEHRDGATLAVVAAGEIDLSNVHAFARALDDASADSDSAMVTVDLRAVDYLDSGAINALFTHADHIHVIANPLLMRVLTISGLTETTTVHPHR